jgi:protein FAM50
MKKKALKNPEVETNFLRDPEREREERELREKLKKEWLETQERIKRESTAPSPKNQGAFGRR